jgi:hypothetical protein
MDSLRINSPVAWLLVTLLSVVMLVIGLYFIMQLFLGARQNVQDVLFSYHCHTVFARCIGGLPIPGK